MNRRNLRGDLNRPDVRAALQEFLDQYTAGKFQGYGDFCRELFQTLCTPLVVAPPVPWELIDRKYRYCTIGDGGTWNLHTGRPQIATTQWTTPYATTVVLPAPQNFMLAKYWKEILLERPAE